MHDPSDRPWKKPLTDADYRAADEVLTRVPERAQNVSHEQTREQLATSHQRMGASRFRLFWGLREPENCCEILERQAYFKQIPKSKFEEHLLWHIDNDLTPGKLSRYFDELTTEVGRYAEIRRDIEGFVYGEIERPTFSEFEEEITDRVRDIFHGSTFYRKERAYIPLFLAEARQESNRTALQFGPLSANSAAGIAELTLGTLRQVWEESFRRSRPNPPEHAPSPFRLMEEEYLPLLPSALQIANWLEDEHVLARRYLRSRTRQAPASQQVVADYVGMVIQNMTVSVTSLVTPAAPASQDVRDSTPTPQLEVEHWSDLAIAIDFELGTRHAMKGVKLGDEFPKKQSIDLHFCHDGWDELLKWLAESPDHQTIAYAKLENAWYRPPSAVETDNRGRRAAQQMAMREELSSTKYPGKKTVRDKLKELRRELREYVDGPTETRRTCLRKVGNNIRAGFCVAYLLRGDSGHLFFGAPRT